MDATTYSLDKFPAKCTKINIDDLFEKRRAREEQRVALFQRILNRLYARIKQCSYGYNSNTFMWYTVPEMIIGTANYSVSHCIAYIIHQLQENDFLVKFYSPNALLITWGHWVPSYIRAEVKKQSGAEIDKFGRIVPPPAPDLGSSDEDDYDNEATNRNPANIDPRRPVYNYSTKPTNPTKPNPPKHSHVYGASSASNSNNALRHGRDQRLTSREQNNNGPNNNDQDYNPPSTLRGVSFAPAHSNSGADTPLLPHASTQNLIYSTAMLDTKLDFTKLY